MNNGLLENIFNDNKDKLKDINYMVMDITNSPGLRQCEHCGWSTRAKGIGTHKQSGRCLSRRQAIYAKLNGYVRAPVEWNRYTAIFQKRFWTDWTEGEANRYLRTAGRLKQQAWVEDWFVQLWAKGSHNVKKEPGLHFTSNPCAEIDLLGEPVRATRKRPPTQVPKPEYQEHFEALVKHKRNNSTKKMDAVRGLLELAMEKSE